MEGRPIPAFYCCYLLRSTVRKTSLYIGSTPDPRRRLGQHNGTTKGGAYKTARQRLRPWEMACIVHGFPSSIAALQFEWAWQHPHISRKIPAELKKKTKTGKPITSLTGRLASLHLLLCSDGFSRWPLTLRFFSADIYQMWIAHCKKEPGTILPILKIVLDQRISEEELVEENGDDEDANPKKARKKAMFAANGKGGVQGLDITNGWLEGHVQHTREVLEKAGSRCDICKQKCDDNQAVVCLNNECNHTAHLTCLSESFLDEEERNTRVRPILPIKGSCPACEKTTVWGDIVRTLSLRTRLKEKSVKAKVATAKPKTTKTSKAKKGKAVAEDPEPEPELLGPWDSDDEFDIMELEVSAMDIAEISEEQKVELSMMDFDASSDEDGDIWTQLKKSRSPSPARSSKNTAKGTKKFIKTAKEPKTTKVTKEKKPAKTAKEKIPTKMKKTTPVKSKTPPKPKITKTSKGITVIELDSDSD